MRKIWLPEDGYADMVIGLQDGDEAKARIVDMLMKLYDWVVRYNGGANAGHTIVLNDIKILLKQIPSGVHDPNKKLGIASECVVSLQKLAVEIGQLRDANIEVIHRLFISCLASVVQPRHILLDKKRRGGIGTTGNGIGDCYADRAARMVESKHSSGDLDIRMGDMFNDLPGSLQRIRENFKMTMSDLRLRTTDIDIEEEIRKIEAAFKQVKNCVQMNPYFLMDAIHQGMTVLLEGAQSIGLDNTYGPKPYTTGSKITPAAALHSTGIDPDYVRYKYGVLKVAPTSKVGHGPFVGEHGGAWSEEYCMEKSGYLHTKEWEMAEYAGQIAEMLVSGDDRKVGIALRLMTDEFGASKRPRRTGRFDLNRADILTDKMGFDGVYLTRVDGWPIYAGTRERMVEIVTGYKLDGQPITHLPGMKEDLYRVEPVLQSLPIEETDVSEARNEGQLSKTVAGLVEFTHNRLNASTRKKKTKILGLGVGPGREQFVPMETLS